MRPPEDEDNVCHRRFDFGLGILDFGFKYCHNKAYEDDAANIILKSRPFLLVFGLLLINFGLFPVNFGLFPVNFGPFPVNFGLLLTTFGLFPVNFGSLLTTFGLFPVNFGSLLTNFGLFPVNFGLLLVNFGLDSTILIPGSPGSEHLVDEKRSAIQGRTLFRRNSVYRALERRDKWVKKEPVGRASGSSIRLLFRFLSGWLFGFDGLCCRRWF